MKLWEIAKGMSEGRYGNGDLFRSGHKVMIIDNKTLWRTDKCKRARIKLGDDSEWEEVK